MSIYQLEQVSNTFITQLLSLSDGITNEKINDFFLPSLKKIPEGFRFETFHSADASLILNIIPKLLNEKNYSKLDNFFKSDEFYNFIKNTPDTNLQNTNESKVQINWITIRNALASSYHFMNEFEGLKTAVLKTFNPKTLYCKCSSTEHLKFLIDNKVPQFQETFKDIWLPLFAINKIFLTKKKSPVVFHDEINSNKPNQFSSKRYTITESNNKTNQLIDTISTLNIENLSEINKNSLATLLYCNNIKKNKIKSLNISIKFYDSIFRIVFEKQKYRVLNSTPFKAIALSDNRENIPSDYKMSLSDWTYFPFLRKIDSSQVTLHNNQNDFFNLNISLLNPNKEDEFGRNAADMMLLNRVDRNIACPTNINSNNLKPNNNFLDCIEYWLNTFKEKGFDLYRLNPQQNSSPFTQLYLSQFDNNLLVVVTEEKNQFEDYLNKMPLSNKEIIKQYWIDNSSKIIDQTMQYIRRNNTNFTFFFNSYNSLINHYLKNPSKELETVFMDKFPEIQQEYNKTEKKLKQIDNIYPAIYAIVSSIKINESLKNDEYIKDNKDDYVSNSFKL